MNRRAFIKAIALTSPAIATSRPPSISLGGVRTLYFPREALLSDAQVIQTRKLSTEEIAAIYKLPVEVICQVRGGLKSG